MQDCEAKRIDILAVSAKPHFGLSKSNGVLAGGYPVILFEVNLVDVLGREVNFDGPDADVFRPHNWSWRYRDSWGLRCVRRGVPWSSGERNMQQCQRRGAFGIIARVECVWENARPKPNLWMGLRNQVPSKHAVNGN